MKGAEFGIFLMVIFLFVAIFSAFTHKPPEDYASAVIPEKILVEVGSLVKLPEITGSESLSSGETDNLLKVRNPLEYCRRKDISGEAINIWACRNYLWR